MPANTSEFLGTGRRKTSVARVRLATGSGKITVNGRPFETYFTTEVLRGMVLQPFNVTQTLNRYDARINVAGGGGPVDRLALHDMALPAHCSTWTSLYVRP